MNSEMENITQSITDSNVVFQDNEDYSILYSYSLLEIKTVQSPPFRCLIEALKEILTDANIEFDETGMKIIAMDASHTVLVHLKLESNNFETFYSPEKITLGISMLNFFKLIKTLGNNDTLSLSVEKDDPNKLGIKIENGEKNSVTRYKLNLMDLPEDPISVPPATFESVITMPSVDFQKLCRDMHNISDYLEIRSVGNQLIFNCKGDIGTAEHVIGENNSGMAFIKNNNPEEIVQGVFALKHLVMFTKCTNLSNQVEIYLKNDYPLIISYGVASLGNIKLCLAPQQFDN
jgi:proliferating cell nuclear antigen